MVAMVQVTSSVNSATRSYRMCTCTAMDAKNSSAKTSTSAAAAMPKVDTRYSIKCIRLKRAHPASWTTQGIKFPFGNRSVHVEKVNNAHTVPIALDAPAGAISGLRFTIVSWDSKMSLLCWKWRRKLLLLITFHSMRKQGHGSSHWYPLLELLISAPMQTVADLGSRKFS